jgi:hypothetical protein
MLFQARERRLVAAVCGKALPRAIRDLTMLQALLGTGAGVSEGVGVKLAGPCLAVRPIVVRAKGGGSPLAGQDGPCLERHLGGRLAPYRPSGTRWPADCPP